MAPVRDNAIHGIITGLLRMAQPEFFRGIRVEGVPLDDPDEHLVVVANHPYGIQDAFLLALAYTRPFYFVATAMNFQRRTGNRIKRRHFRAWLLSQCHVLPVVRNRTEGHMSSNIKTFETVAARVAEGYALGIFAEGDSRGNQWNLLKLKAGAAQIALQVAEILAPQSHAPCAQPDACGQSPGTAPCSTRQPSGKQLKIQVVGLTYTNWDRPFKSSVTLRCAEPFAVAPVDRNDRSAVRAARRDITKRIGELMVQLTVQIPDQFHTVVGKIAQFYSAEYGDDYVRLKTVGEHVTRLAHAHGSERRELEEKLDEYLDLAERLKIYPGEERVGRSELVLLLAALPAYLGYLLHWPILWATARTVRPDKTPRHALGSKQVGWGVGFTLAWYGVVGGTLLVLAGMKWGLGGISIVLIALSLMAFCGLVASRYFRHVNFTVRRILPGQRRFRRYLELGRELLGQLESYRLLVAPADANADAAKDAVGAAEP